MRIKSDEERLYFIIRALILGQIGTVVFLIGVLILGSVNFIQAIVLGIIMTIISFAGSRMLDSQIDQTVNSVLKKIDRHKRLRHFTIKYF